MIIFLENNRERYFSPAKFEAGKTDMKISHILASKTSEFYHMKSILFLFGVNFIKEYLES